MPLQEIYYIAEMVVGVAFIISLVFVAVELRQNTYMTRSSLFVINVLKSQSSRSSRWSAIDFRTI